MTILFYSSVKNVNQFNESSFYKDDIFILKNLGYKVILTNKISHFITKKYDAAFLYFYTKSLFCAIIARIFRKKIVFTGGIDNLTIYPKSLKYKILFKVCYIISNYCNIVSTTDYLKCCQILDTIPVFNYDKLSYHPHCINLFDIRKNISIDSKEDIITTICWMGSKTNVIRKGVDVSLIYFSYIKSLYPDFKFIIIGSFGEGKLYLDEIINKLNIGDSVHFTNTITEEEKFLILEKSRYYFQLSKYEGFGCAVLEAAITLNYIFHTNKGGLMDTISTNGEIINTNYNKNDFLDTFKKVQNDYNNKIFKLKEFKQIIISKFSVQKRQEYLYNLFK